MDLKVSIKALSLCLLIGATGCVSPKAQIQTKRDISYTGKLERVLIIYHNEEDADPRLGRKFSDAFLTRFSEVLAQKGVVSEVVRPNKEEVDENTPVRSAAAKFHPSQALHFGLVRVASHNTAYRSSVQALPRFSHGTSMAFAFSLFDVARGQTVWRGELQYLLEPDPKSVADQFVERLASEKFLAQR